MKGNGSAVSDAPKDDAAAWYVANQIRGDNVDDRTVCRWAEWYDQPENRAKYDSIVEVGQLARELPRPTEARNDELLSDLAQMSFLPDQPNSRLSARIFRLRSMPRTRIFAAIAGVALSVALIGLVAWLHDQPAAPGRLYATGPGEQRDFTLEDGSSITLGGDTSIEVRFSSSGRLVVLTRGEGMFRVQHDIDRPFSVCAASGCTTAVGTVFDVRLYSGHTRVWVQEGAVVVASQKGGTASEVTPALNSADWKPVRLAPSQEVAYQDGGQISNTTVVDPTMAAAWTNGALIYYGRPLGEVLEDVQRYTSRKLDFSQGVTRQLYSGSVLQKHIEQWLRGLPQIFPIKIVDCQNLRESIGNENEEVTRSCTSDPSRILVRSR